MVRLSQCSKTKKNTMSKKRKDKGLTNKTIYVDTVD